VTRASAGRRTLWLWLLACCCACSAAPSGRARTLGPEAVTRLVDSATALMRRYALHRDQVDWQQLSAAARAAVASAPSPTPATAYRAIRGVLKRLGDHHSLLLEPEVAIRLSRRDSVHNALPTLELRDSSVGYVRIPRYAGFDPTAIREYAQRLQAQIGQMAAQGACSWVVDLRENTGGNMWPMLAGLGPLLGEGAAGGFATPDSLVQWGYRRGAAWSGRSTQVRLSRPVTLTPLPPVAVLTDSQTASSGEAIAIAFRGRPRTRSFGRPTRGLSTGNQGFTLPDGSMLFLTTVVDVDRTGQRYGGTVLPDERATTDSALHLATAWLATQGCTRAESQRRPD
jgi:Peptidase family S41